MQVKTILIVWKVAEDFLHGKTKATISRPWKFARQIGCTWRKVQCKRGQKVWPTPGTWRCLITASLQRPRIPGTASKMPCLLTTNVLTRSPNWRHKGSASWRKKTKRHVASRTSLRKRAKRPRRLTRLEHVQEDCMALIGPSCLAGPTKGEEDLQLEEEEGLRPLASRWKDHREGRMNQKAKKNIYT